MMTPFSRACSPCPTKVPFYQHGNTSYAHGVLGVASAFIPGTLAAIITLGFVVYQMSEVEPLPDKIGDLAEYAAGFMAGKAIKWGVA